MLSLSGAVALQPFNSIVTIVVFVLLGVGVDDAFLLIGALDAAAAAQAERREANGTGSARVLGAAGAMQQLREVSPALEGSPPLVSAAEVTATPDAMSS